MTEQPEPTSVKGALVRWSYAALLAAVVIGIAVAGCCCAAAPPTTTTTTSTSTSTTTVPMRRFPGVTYEQWLDAMAAQGPPPAPVHRSAAVDVNQRRCSRSPTSLGPES